jgi:hypothetical protein
MTNLPAQIKLDVTELPLAEATTSLPTSGEFIEIMRIFLGDENDPKTYCLLSDRFDHSHEIGYTLADIARSIAQDGGFSEDESSVDVLAVIRECFNQALDAHTIEISARPA